MEGPDKAATDSEKIKDILAIIEPDHLENLRASGLTDETITKAGLFSATTEKVSRLLGFKSPCGGLVFPYPISPFFNAPPPSPQHDAACIAQPTENYLTRLNVRLSRPIKKQRYATHRGAGNCLYFPPNLPEGWMNSTQDVYITEGEKKALLACQLGLICLGIRGVTCGVTRGSDGVGSILIKDLTSRHLNGRNIIIVFDSDNATNTNVRRAQEDLCERLTNTHKESKVFIKNLPEAEDSLGQKMGLDDFVLANGFDSFMALPLIPADEIEEALMNGIQRLSMDIIGIKSIPSHFIVIKTGDMIRYYEAGGTPYGTTHYPALSADGKLVPAFPLWKTGERPFIDKFVCTPSQDRLSLIKTKTGEIQYNTWQGWGVQPIATKTMPEGLWEIIRNMGSFPKSLNLWSQLDDPDDEGTRFSVELQVEYLALITQNAGKRAMFASLLVSATKGVGKSLLGDLMIDIFGRKHAMEMRNDQLFDKFTTWNEATLFSCVNEVSTKGHFGEDFNNEIKAIVTERETQYNQKGVQKAPAPSRMNLLLTSNEMSVKYDPRRLLIHQYPPSAIPLNHEVGDVCRGQLGLILGYLLQYPIKHLKVGVPPPLSKGGEVAMCADEDPVVEWVKDYLLSEVGANHMFVVSDLTFKIFNDIGLEVSNKGMGKILSEMGMSSKAERVNGRMAKWLKNSYRKNIERDRELKAYQEELQQRGMFRGDDI